MNMSLCEKFFIWNLQGTVFLLSHLVCYSDACLAINVVEVMLKAKIWQKAKPVCQITWSPSQKFLDSQFDPLQGDCDFENTSPMGSDLRLLRNRKSQRFLLFLAEHGSIKGLSWDWFSLVLLTVNTYPYHVSLESTTFSKQWNSLQKSCPIQYCVYRCLLNQDSCI